MFGRNGGVKSRVSSAAGAVRSVVGDYGDPLAKDEKLRRRLLEALTIGVAVRERARRQRGFTGVARRLATDPVLRTQLQELATEVRAVQRRLEKQHSHKVRNGVLFAVGAGMVAAAVVPAARKAMSALFGGDEDRSRGGPATPERDDDGSGSVGPHTVVTPTHGGPEDGAP